MAGGEQLSLPSGGPSPLISSLFFMLFLLPLTIAKSAINNPLPVSFSPADAYLLDCGAPKSVQLPDGRTFRSEPQSSSFLSTDEDIRLSSASPLPSLSPLYHTARVFSSTSTYSFFITKLGLHFIRLHFFPFPSPSYNLSSAIFTVSTEDFVLLRDFSVPSPASSILKEYLINVENERLYLTFAPIKGSFAFLSALEVVSAPETLIPTSAASISPQEQFSGINNYALEIIARVNVGGEGILSEDDLLAREWLPDSFLKQPEPVEKVIIAPEKIKYPEDGSVTPLIAPRNVYATADSMMNANVSEQMFNVTWEIPVDGGGGYSYLVRLHFCDIVSRNLNSLYFNVFINRIMAIPNLDLSSLTGGNLAMAYYKDFIVAGTTLISGNIALQISPPVLNDPGLPNAILNGIEIMKMSNNAGSLDGPYSVDGSYHGDDLLGTSRKKVMVAAFGLVIGASAMALVAVIFIRWRRRPEDWRKKHSFLTWLLPLHFSRSVLPGFMGNWTGKCSSPSKNRGIGSHKSKSGYTSYLVSGALGVGRYFTFAELQLATGNFDDNNVIGVGGFGRVYLGVLNDGTKLAIKRGSPSSDQGVNEFHTEIEMLSKLRHRHLVSLIGCCDEDSEMILVYEFMANGPLRDHLYPSSPSLVPLAWKQRLEICIGAARGLHYLHTGAAQGIIHRDVKTTNILLDENLVAKMSDFGLSKAGPSSLDQTHVSTAVKGSFGYLDPEYFRRQQLTDKSDVYSFGVVMIELLCARPAINPTLPRDQVNLAEWAMQWHRKGQVEMIVDPHLVGRVGPASLKKFVEAAEKCLADSGVDRPTMGDVLWNLEYALQLQEAWMGLAKENDYASDIAKTGGLHVQQLDDRQRMERTNEDEVIPSDSASAAGPAPLSQGR